MNLRNNHKMDKSWHCRLISIKFTYIYSELLLFLSIDNVTICPFYDYFSNSFRRPGPDFPWGYFKNIYLKKPRVLEFGGFYLFIVNSNGMLF